jgi:hypothetical protein
MAELCVEIAKLQVVTGRPVIRPSGMERRRVSAAPSSARRSDWSLTRSASSRPTSRPDRVTFGCLVYGHTPDPDSNAARGQPVRRYPSDWSGHYANDRTDKAAGDTDRDQGGNNRNPSGLRRGACRCLSRLEFAADGFQQPTLHPGTGLG